MKLVEIDDRGLTTCVNNPMIIDDESYSKLRVMSNLDNVMNEILKTPMSDAEKWTLYSQVLQKYLNHAKISSRKIDTNILPVNNNNESNRFPVDEQALNKRTT